MHNIYIITLFLIVKIFQWLNSFVLVRLFSADKNYTIIISAFIFISVIFVFGLLIKKFLPKALGIVWIFVVFALIITLFVHYSWVIIFLAGLFLYALIGMEVQVLQSFSHYRNIPRFALFLLSLFPITLSYQIPQTRVITPQLFYLISSILVFFASYSARNYGEGKVVIYQKAPPIWLGLFFITISGILCYLGFYKTTKTIPAMFLAFVLLFYEVGALAIYMSIDEHLRKTHKIQ